MTIYGFFLSNVHDINRPTAYVQNERKKSFSVNTNIDGLQNTLK